MLRRYRSSIAVILAALCLVPFLPIVNEVQGKVEQIVFQGKNPPNPSYKGHFLMVSVITGLGGVFGQEYTIGAFRSNVDDHSSLDRVRSWRAAYHDATVFLKHLKISEIKLPTIPLIGITDTNSTAKIAGLQGGDLLLSVNGTPAPTPNQLDKLQSQNTELHITVHRDGVAGSITKIVHRDPKLTYSPYGIYLEYSFQADEAFDANMIVFGGPSAGLMTFLADLAARSSGSLSGGHLISGTGAIDGSGAVLPIGEVEYKVKAAIKSKASVFFVPTDNYRTALIAAGVQNNMAIVPVATELDALKWLCNHGATTTDICSTYNR